MADDGCWDVFGEEDDESDPPDDQQTDDVVKACEAGALYLTQEWLRFGKKGVPLTQRQVCVMDDCWHDSLQKRGMHIVFKRKNFIFCDGAVLVTQCISTPNATVSPTPPDVCRRMRHGLVPGGILLWMGSSLETCKSSFDARVWDASNAETLYSGGTDFVLVALRRRPCPINEASCPWKPSGGTSSHLEHERHLLSQATVTRSAQELLSKKRLTESGLQQAVTALQTHGYCVIRSLLHTNKCLEWGTAVVKDFDAAATILKQRDNIDLRNPQNSGQDPQSYREMAMREDLRVDLRDGPNLRRLREEERQHYEEWKLGDEVDDEGPTITTSEGSVSSCLRFHADILEIVKRTMNPQDKNSELYRGNFGRYNFDGSGPDGSHQPIRIGPMGGIVSLPGSADQAVHADTPHLFEHMDCLPAHYINAFALGAQSVEGIYDEDGNYTGSTPVGGTAFVDGSHRLSVTAGFCKDEEHSNAAASIMGDGVDREEMFRNLVRPSLQVGDVVIFDCRVLHFGLANTSADVERPMLYVNLTHAWFHDPKNWDDRQRIFD